MNSAGDAQATLATLFARAMALHRQGQIGDAEQLCDQILAQWPRHFGALHLRGFIALQGKRLDEGIAFVTRAIAVSPNDAAAHRTLAVGLRQAKRTEQALASLDRALALRPDYAEVYYERGLILAYLLRYTEALACQDRAIALNPSFFAAYVERGTVLQTLKRPAAAVDSHDRAIALRPNAALPHFNRGVALADLKQYDDALGSYDRAIALQPNFAQAYNNRGELLGKLQRREEALASYDSAIALDVGFMDAHYNRATLLAAMNQHEAALAGYETVIALKSDYAAAHWNRSLSLLTLGRFEEGWPEFEWRKRIRDSVANRAYPRPLWLGKEPIAGRTLFVYAEQGLGDTLQFCRYVSVLSSHGARVVLEVQRPLHALLAHLTGAQAVIARGTPLPSYDAQCPLMSLPLACGTTRRSIPAAIPYLATPGDRLVAWQARVGPRVRPRVGLAWWGLQHLAYRSIPLPALAPLLRQPGVTFHGLQKDVPPPHLQWIAAHPLLTLHDAGLADFADTAALIAQMDLVITIDTAVAHLAGALGARTWVMLPHQADWRWGLDTTTPWYPNMRLFRQTRAGEWDPVIQSVCAALEQFLADAA